MLWVYEYDLAQLPASKGFFRACLSNSNLLQRRSSIAQYSRSHIERHTPEVFAACRHLWRWWSDNSVSSKQQDRVAHTWQQHVSNLHGPPLRTVYASQETNTFYTKESLMLERLVVFDLWHHFPIAPKAQRAESHVHNWHLRRQLCVWWAVFSTKLCRHNITSKPIRNIVMWAVVHVGQLYAQVGKTSFPLCLLYLFRSGVRTTGSCRCCMIALWTIFHSTVQPSYTLSKVWDRTCVSLDVYPP